MDIVADLKGIGDRLFLYQLCNHGNHPLQLSPEQVAPLGSASLVNVDEGSYTTDSCTSRDDFTATAKISELCCCLEVQ